MGVGGRVGYGLTASSSVLSEVDGWSAASSQEKQVYTYMCCTRSLLFSFATLYTPINPLEKNFGLVIIRRLARNGRDVGEQ